MQTLQFLSQLHVGFYNSFYLKIASLALTCYLSLSLTLNVYDQCKELKLSSASAKTTAIAS